MKNLPILIVLSLALVFSSCRRDDDDEGGSTALTGLAAFLNGEFDVVQADYNGSIQTAFGNFPLAGTGEGTNGSYNFMANANKVDYRVQSTMSVTIPILTQSIDVPINVDNVGDIEYSSSTQFIIQDPDLGPMTYNISNKTSTGLVATTRYQTDTLGATIDLLLDVYLEKK
jgi:hypothetical protein